MTAVDKPDAEMPRADKAALHARLSRLQGPGQLRAALLALVCTPGSSRELRAWHAHTQGIAGAAAIYADLYALGADARLPWFELLLARMKRHGEADRKALVDAARNVMVADGKVRPQDRLLWLTLRHGLGEAPAPRMDGEADNDLSRVSAEAAQAIASLTAFLARLVPQAGAEQGVGEGGEGWYADVIEHCLPAQQPPPCTPPDADAMLRALRVVQALPWLLRPVLVRAWVEAGLRASPAGSLARPAADALRLACRLLDSPIPPALLGHYIELSVAV